MQCLYDGDLAIVTATVKDEETKELIDPTNMSLIWTVKDEKTNAVVPAGIFIYDGSAIVPAVGTLARLSRGTFQVWIDTTGRIGVHTCKAKSTGVGQATSLPYIFQVVP